MPEPRILLTLLVLLAGAGFTTFLALDGDEAGERAQSPELSLAFYLDKAELTGTDESGRIIYRLTTVRAEQSPQDASIGMQQVAMDYDPPNGLPWDVRANTGRISADASIIELTGNVIAVSGEAQPERTVILTDQLEIDPATMEASTRRRVTISFAERRLNATGMQANFETNTLKLLANVNGKFVP